MLRPTTKAAARVNATALELEPDRAPLLFDELVAEAALLEPVMLAEPLDPEDEARVLVGAALPEDVVVALAAAVDDEPAAVEVPRDTSVPLTTERGTLVGVELLWVM